MKSYPENPPDGNLRKLDKARKKSRKPSEKFAIEMPAGSFWKMCEKLVNKSWMNPSRNCSSYSVEILGEIPRGTPEGTATKCSSKIEKKISTFCDKI